MTAYLIGIDNGSQSTKVSVFDERGRVVSQGRQPLRPPATPKPGVVEHPDDDIWSSIGAASRAAMKALAAATGGTAGAKKAATEIVGVGLCTIRFCRALLRADGTLASPVMSWMDARVSRPHERTDPEVRYVTTSSGYITHRMTGQFKDTAANYQGVWPISTDRWGWLGDDEGFASYNVGREMVFELVLPGDVLGYVTPEAAAHTGIPEGLPVVATANDKAVEALGCGLRSPAQLLVSLGTYIASMTTGETNLKNAKEFWPNFAAIPHRYLYESHGIRRGMWTVSWWRGLLGAELERAAARSGTTVEGRLDEEASAISPGSDGLMAVLDWLGPLDAPFKKGSMLGFDVRHGRAHVHRAILEGIALTISRCARAMAGELGHHYTQLVVSGGGSASDLFMQIFADVFGTETARPTVSDAAGLGAAICAAVGLGLYRSWGEAVDQMTSWQPPFTPDADAHRVYDEMAPVYGSIPAATDPIYQASYGLFG